MTSYERSPADIRLSPAAHVTTHVTDGTMREFRRPTLCVIDEHGVEISQTAGLDSLSENGDAADNVSVCSDEYSLGVRDHNANVTKVENSNYLTTPPSVVPEKDLDLSELKATTERLKLSTRRNSTVAWQREHLDASKAPVFPKIDRSSVQYSKLDDTFTEERKNRINEALAWIRSELLQMRNEDETLARKLLSIRHDIHKLKLQRSCEEHQDMLDDVTLDMEEYDVINEISDMPLTGSMHGTPLKHLGVTRMHLSARRFSTC